MSDKFKLLGSGNAPQGIKRIKQVLFKNDVIVNRKGWDRMRQTESTTKEHIKGIAWNGTDLVISFKGGRRDLISPINPHYDKDGVLTFVQTSTENSVAYTTKDGDEVKISFKR